MFLKLTRRQSGAHAKENTMTDRVLNTSQASFAADVVAAERPVLVDF